MKEQEPAFRVLLPDGKQIDVQMGFVSGDIDKDLGFHYAYCPDGYILEEIERLLDGVNQRNPGIQFSLQRESVTTEED